MTQEKSNDIIIYHYGYTEDKERRNNMTLTDAQRRAKAKYKSQKVKKILVEFYATDTELWEKLQAQDNKQGYIKELIRKDLK